MTINKFEAIKLLSIERTVFKTTLDAIKEEWKPDEPPITILMIRFSDAFVSELDDLSPSELRSVFNLIELLVVEGDQSVKDATTTGFLESLQNKSDSKQLDFAKIKPYLRHETEHYCKSWDNFTGAETHGLW